MAAMEPPIQYVKTADGVGIAFWTLGHGMPFVQMPAELFSHVQLEWQVPSFRRWYEWLAEKRTVVRYDGRGTGLSERDVADYSLDALLLDLEAVVDRLALEKFALLGCFAYGAVAIAYAARHPDRVSHLLLWCAMARHGDYPPAVRALEREVGGRDWGLYADTLAGLIVVDPEEIPAVATFIRESVTPEAAEAMINAERELDVAYLLPQVTARTLVLHRRQYQLLDVGVARRLASGIPDSRLALLEGRSPLVFVEHVESVVAAIDEFLDEGEEPAAAAAPSGLVTVLFTDMEGSTTLTQRLGDAKAQELLRTHNTIVRHALKACDGSEIKHTGDGIMASFPSASRALDCAIAIQRAVAARAEEQPEPPLRVRIGLNAGEPVAEEKDLFGTAVQLAARICAHAEPSQILAPTVVRELVAGKGFLLADQGDVVLRGFEDPVRLYEVRWQQEA
jgi:class 3 adenylate cyclase